jgi:hypothetical protein
MEWLSNTFKAVILRARRNAAEREMAELWQQRERDEERLRVPFLCPLSSAFACRLANALA